MGGQPHRQWRNDDVWHGSPAASLPGDGLPGLGQHIVGVVPGPGLRQTGTGGHPHPVQADLGLPHAAVRCFTDDLPGVIPGDRVLSAVRMFHDEGSDLAFVVPGPDDHDIGDGAVADPPLVPVQHPLVTLAPRPGFQRNHVGAVLGFGQGKGAENFTGRHPWQILGLLLFGAQHRDGRHREPGMYGVQGGDAAVAAGQFGGDYTLGEKRHPGATVPDDRGAGDAEPPIALGQFDRELCPLPITGSSRCHLRVAPLPDPITHLAFLVGQQFIQTVEISPPGNRKIITIWELILGAPGIKIGNVLGHRKSRRVHAWVLLSCSNRCVGMGETLMSVLRSPRLTLETMAGWAESACRTSTRSPPARHRYHAMAAVAMPRTPPSLVRSGLDANAPKLSRKNTTARTANRAASTAVVRSAAITMRVVKIAHAIRNHPAACPWLAAGTSFA